MIRLQLATIGVLCALIAAVAGQDECVCNAWGDPHYRTFDGVAYDFMGKCKYIFAESLDGEEECPFSVQVWNSDRGIGHVSFTEAIEISLMDQTFLFKKGKVLIVNGQVVQSKAVTEFDNVQVMLAGAWLVLSSAKCSLRVEWNGDENISVKLKKNRWSGKVRGLCANCDGNAGNDFIDKNGFQAANGPAFAATFITHDPQAQRQECVVGKIEKVPPVNPNDPCQREWERRPRELKYCGAFLAETNGPFTQCIKQGRVNVDTLYKACRFDVCTNKENLLKVSSIVCESLENFALACAEQGFAGINWRGVVGCDMKCGANQEYRPQLAPCQTSCDSKREGASCPQGMPPREGCVCKAGFIMYGAECVTIDKCPPKKEVSLTFSRTKSSKKEQIHNLDKGFAESFSEEASYTESGTPLTMKKSGSKSGHHKEDKSNKEENFDKTEGSFNGDGSFFGGAGDFMKSFNFN